MTARFRFLCAAGSAFVLLSCHAYAQTATFTFSGSTPLFPLCVNEPASGPCDQLGQVNASYHFLSLLFPNTNHFYANSGGNIHRLNDRLFVGGATDNDGNAPVTTKDWLESDIPNTTTVAQLSATSRTGQSAIVAGTRTSDAHDSMGIPTGVNGFGLSGFAINDYTAFQTLTTGGFFQGRAYSGLQTAYFYNPTVASNTGTAGFAVNDRITLAGGTFTTPAVLKVTAVSAGKPTMVAVFSPGNYANAAALPSNPVSMSSTSGSGTGSPTFNLVIDSAGEPTHTLGMEVDSIPSSGATVGSINPYDTSVHAATWAIQDACGDPGITDADCTVALSIVNNAAVGSQSSSGRFTKGIMIGNTAILGDNGSTGTGSAIAMAKGHQVEWYVNGLATPQALIRSDIDSTSASTTESLTFVDGGTLIGSATAGAQTLSVVTDALNVNSIQLSGGHSGLPVGIQAAGASTNVGMVFAPKGSGGTFFQNSATNQLIAWGPEGHLRVSSVGAPSVSSCGGSGSVSGSDQAGLIFIGTSATGCTLSWHTAYSSAPYCVVTSQSPTSTLQYTPTASGLTLSGGASSSNYNYICMAQTNG